MAHVCYDCQRIFPSQKANCPFCGGRIYFDERSNSLLQNAGFTVSDVTSNTGNSTGSSADFSINDSDILSSLRQSYDREHRRNTRPSDNVSSYASHDNSTSYDNTSVSDDFFSQFETSNAPSTSIPTVGSTYETRSTFTPPANYDSDNSSYTIDDERRWHNRNRGQAILNFLRYTNWHAVSRVFLVIAIVIGAAAIWHMRYVILESITDFIMALIPLVITVWILVTIIKSLFRR